VSFSRKFQQNQCGNLGNPATWKLFCRFADAVGSICCGLSSRGDGTFHWTLLFPIDTTTAIKIHATNFQGPWEFEKTYQTLETSPSATICVVVKIGASVVQHHVFHDSQFTYVGEMPGNTFEYVCELLRAIPMEVPDVFSDSEQRFSCRVWVKAAWRVMDANDIIKCSDVVALERKMWDLGKEHDPLTITGAPFKFHTARSSCSIRT